MPRDLPLYGIFDKKIFYMPLTEFFERVRVLGYGAKICLDKKIENILYFRKKGYIILTEISTGELVVAG